MPFIMLKMINLNDTEIQLLVTMYLIIFTGMGIGGGDEGNR
jgi:hypothetical protein